MRRTFTLTIVLTTFVLLAAACRSETKSVTDVSGATTSTTVTTAATLTPEQLGELGAKIKQQPADAQRLLSEHGLNEQTFEQQIRKVSEDPSAAKRYAAAFNNG